MKRNYCLSLVLLALFGVSVPYSAVAADNVLSSQSTQQAKTITGKVVDVAGEPIIGASVLVKGSGQALLRRVITATGDTAMKYVCDICGYVYDPAAGDPDNGVAPGTPWEAVPEDWVCPLCGVGKDQFSPKA